MAARAANLERRPGESISERVARITAVETERAIARLNKEKGEKQYERRDSVASLSGAAVIPAHDSRLPTEPSAQEETSEDLLSLFRNGRTASAVLKQTPGAASSSPSPVRKVASNVFLGFGNATSQQHRNPAKTQSEPAAKLSDQQDRRSTSRSITPTASRRTSDAVLADASSAAVAMRRGIQQDAAGLSERTSVSAKNKKSFLSEAPKATGKRPSDTNPSNHERTLSFDALPKIQKKASAALTRSPDGTRTPDSFKSPDSGIDAEIEKHPPRWYEDEPRPTRRNPAESDGLTLLQRLKTAIDKGDIEVVRHVLHELPFQQVSKPLLKLTHMLTPGRCLQKIFGTEDAAVGVWPYDIRADAEELYKKWSRQIFETDLLRGLLLSNKKEGRNTDVIRPGYPGKVSFKAFGNNNLSNGQWFPTQLTTLRDGAHGATQGGISGKPGEGAYSCIMTGQSGYPDEDNGHEVQYCGTDSENGLPSERTQMLLDNMKSRNPVRFIRKSTLKSEWAPQVGYRYDGLYDVKSFEILVAPDQPKAARHRFRLVRREGQDPIRGGSGAAARPTEQEVHRYKQDKRFR